MKFLKRSDGKRAKTKNPSINRAKSREIANKSQSFDRKSSISSSADEDNTELLANLDKLIIPNAELITSEQEVSFQDALQAFDDSLTAEERKNKKRKPPKKSKNKKIKEREEKRKQQTIECIKIGDLNTLTTLINNYIENNCENDSDAVIKTKITNETLDEQNNTLLHLAAFYQHAHIVRYLLEIDANPCNKNKKQQTPYTITQNLNVREIFKQFAQENPNKYNYNKANIPLVALTAEEAAEKKKQQRKYKREKEKVRKMEKQIERVEEMEKEKFLQLSDMEKVCWGWKFCKVDKWVFVAEGVKGGGKVFFVWGRYDGEGAF